MLRYAAERIFWPILTVISMSPVTFIIRHLTSGSPLDPSAMGANPLGAEAQAVLNDYPMMVATVLLLGVFLAVMNLIVDLLYGWVDPHIRYRD